MNESNKCGACNGRGYTDAGDPETGATRLDYLCVECDGMGIRPRRLMGYGECKCILTQYCDGKCNPIFEDE